MKRTGLIIFAMLWTWCLWGQTFHTPWIAALPRDSDAHVWFRQTYLNDGKPRQAFIDVTSTGYYKLYVNEFNVGTPLYYPPRTPGSDSPMTMSFSVTSYLRPDTNVVALLYAPSGGTSKACQIAVTYYGTLSDGRPFCHTSDDEWLWRPANSRNKRPRGEIVDGRNHNTIWKSTTYAQALWRHVCVPTCPQQYPHKVLTARNPMIQVVKRVTDPVCIVRGDSVDYVFGHSFFGQVRLTLRDATPGERLSIGNIDYICNGDIDEQASPVFDIAPVTTVTVRGDRHFHSSQITEVEGVETATIPTWQVADGW